MNGFVNEARGGARSSRYEKGHKARQQPSMASPYAILLFDSVVAFLSIFISIHLRIGMDFLDYSQSYIIKNMFVFGLVSSSVFLWLQIHQSFWRYTSIEDMAPIFLSVILSNLLFFPLMILMNQEDFLPYSVLIINIFVLSFMLMIPRFLTRMMYNQKINKIKKYGDLHHGNNSRKQSDSPQVILIGSTAANEIFLREVINNEDITFNFTPVGILAMDPEDIGRVIKGIPILGEVRELGRILRELREDDIIPKQLVITEKTVPEYMKNFLARYVQDHELLLMHVIHQYTCNPVT
jgi:O-antigen biosynthesis protein WbqV